MILSALAVIAALLRLYMLTNQSLWLDEGASLAMTDGGDISSTLNSLWSIAGGDKYQPVYFTLLALWRSFMGDSQFMLQLLSVIPGVLTPVIIFLGARNVFGERHAIFSALFIALSSFCITYSQEVRPYAFLLCLACLQFLVFSPVLKNPGTSSRGRRALFAVVTLICCSSSILLGLFSLSMAAAHGIVYRQIRSWIRWWLPTALVSIPAGLYYLSTPTRSNLSVDAVNSTGIPLWENLVFSLYGHIAGQSYGPSLNTLRDADQIGQILIDHGASLSLLTALCVVLAVYTIISLRRMHQQQAEKIMPCFFFLTLFIVSLAGAAVLALLTTLNWMPRHSFYLMLPLSILLPIAVIDNQRRAKREKPMTWVSIPMIAFSGIILINQFANYNYFYKAEYARDDYRSAASFLNDHVKEGDASILLWGQPYLLSYYGHSNVESIWQLQEPQLIMNSIDMAASLSDTVFISISRENSWNRYSQTLQRQLSASYTLEPVANFVSFTIFKLKKSVPTLARRPMTVTVQNNQDQNAPAVLSQFIALSMPDCPAPSSIFAPTPTALLSVSSFDVSSTSSQASEACSDSRQNGSWLEHPES